ncbi:MAG: hypothetical protein WC365_04230, partial [Candidatus Babeliales bacterium]
KGITQHPADITMFIKKLATHHADYNFALLSLTKQKHRQDRATNEPVLYTFAIQGLMQKT